MSDPRTNSLTALAWTEADALRLINAIDTICDLFDVIGLQKAASPLSANPNP